jgi:hypothetical protein
MYKLISYFGEQPKAVRKYTSEDKTQWIDTPFEPTSIDYQEYLDWLAEGNTPLPAEEVTQ